MNLLGAETNVAGLLAASASLLRSRDFPSSNRYNWMGAGSPYYAECPPMSSLGGGALDHSYSVKGHVEGGKSLHEGRSPPSLALSHPFPRGHQHQQPHVSREAAEGEHCTRPTAPAIGKPCHLGSGTIDVEDLALYFELAKVEGQPNCPTNSTCTARQTQAYPRRFPIKDGGARSENCEPSEFRLNEKEELASSEGSWLEQLCKNQSTCEECPTGGFPLCPEAQWLQCPVSDCCPLYDTSNYNPEEGMRPPCYYQRENFVSYEYEYMPHWPHPYFPDDQLLEDYLSNEKRKERSRDAARCRRSRETDIFSDLAAVLPISQEQAAHLDKASVMRLAIAYLKVRAVVDSIPVPVAKSESSTKMDRLFPKALNGFMLVLSSDGSMVYLSENVTDYLGISQMDMMGQSVYEYSHPCDHEELRECLSSKPHEIDDSRSCSFFLRLKCTLTSKGRKVNLKSASYKVIHCIGRLAKIRDRNFNSAVTATDEEAESDDGSRDREREPESETSLVLVGSPIPHPSNIEMPLGRHTFLSKHNLNMKFTYADEKLAEYLGWTSEELVGQSVFEFYHALDNLTLDKSFKSLFSKGQCETVAYRFLSKRGGYAWVVTQATVIHCSKQHKPLSVVCVNYILSGVEREDEVYSAKQLAARDSERALSEKKAARKELPEEEEVIEEAKKKKAKEDEVRSSEEQIQREARSSRACKSPDRKLTLELRIRKRDLVEEEEEEELEELEEVEEECFVSTERQISVALQKELEAGLERRNLNGDKPLAVTASIFRPAIGGGSQGSGRKVSRAQDGSRKDNTFPRPIRVTEKTFSTGARASKKSIEGPLKENEEPQIQGQELPEKESESFLEEEEFSPRRSEKRTPFVFQGKPALEYNRNTAERRYRPQAVTKFLFTPLASASQPQLHQQLPPQEQLPSRSAPQTATARIFAPRTEDMNKGFLTFSEDQPGLTMLKDEPEDLTHLAPTPGDVCVPLEDTPFLSDMLDDFILGNDNYCPLLSPGGTIPSSDFGDTLKESELVETSRSKTLGDSLTDGGDPFMYADCPSSPAVDPTAVSPALNKYHQSPESSMESLSSPTTGSSTEGFSEDEMLMLGISDSIADEELELRAPYIPMSDQDETLEQLMSDEMVMWGADTHTADKLSSKWLIDERDQASTESSLAQLLKTDQIGSKKYNDHGGGLVSPTQVLGQIPRKGAAAFEIGRWPSKGSNDRPSKRIHATISHTENENKRIKCDGSSELENSLKLQGDILLGKRPSSAKPVGFESADCQLLRRLVSQQTTISQSDYPGTMLSDADLASPRNSTRKVAPGAMIGTERNLEVERTNANVDVAVAVAVGGRGIGRSDGDSEAASSHQDTSGKGRVPCNSVLMNLLVSGCDDVLEESRCVPTLSASGKYYGSPLSVCLDNQMVPQCLTSNGSSISFDQLDSERGKGVNGIGDFSLSEETAATTSSPTSVMSFDMMDYDPGISETGLLQVNPEFFGTLLDQNLV